jgi:predicted enzyme related to lactoylglutathione lyase
MAQTRFESVMPEMPVRNLSAAVEFYSDVLGFKLEHLHGDEYAVMRREGARVGLLRATPDTTQPGQGRFYAFLNGIDAFFASVQQSSAVGRIKEALAARPYGLKDFTMSDLDGNRLAFGEQL